MCGFGCLDEGLEPRLADHVEPPDLGRMLGNGNMLVRQIIDKDCHAGSVVGNDPGKRLALAALVGNDREIDANRAQLLSSGDPEIIGQVGEDHDIGLGADRVYRVDRPVDSALSRHFGAEEALEQWPDIGAGYQFARRLVAQRIGKIAKVEVEMDVMRFV